MDIENDYSQIDANGWKSHANMFVDVSDDVGTGPDPTWKK